MKKLDVSFVLVEPCHPGNIGSCARALKNTDFEDLRLVNPVDFKESSDAQRLAFGAKEILQNAKIYQNTIDAVDDSEMIIATSNLKREDKKTIFPDEIISIVNKTGVEKISILFGSEHNGLEQKDLELSGYYCHVPSAVRYPSYNLSQAVQIVAYSIFSQIYSVEVKNHYHLIRNHEKEILIEKVLKGKEDPKGEIRQGLHRILSHTIWDDKDLRFFYHLISQSYLTFQDDEGSKA